MDDELKKIAEDWAEGIIQNIYLAYNNPEYKLEGESLSSYVLLKEWDWFDLCPISSDGEMSEENEILTRKFFAIQKYAKLKWDKEHPQKGKKSKWEIVTGRSRKR